MNAEHGAVSRIVAALVGGAAVTGVVVGAGLGLTGTLSVVDEPATVADAAVASYYDCPDGDALGELTRGDRVFITGRDASGEWAEIRSPVSSNSRVWIRARQVLPDGDTSDLPVLGCLEPVDAIVSAVEETTTTTEAVDTTATTGTTEPPPDTTTATTEAPSTTQTTGTTAPPPPPDTTPPAISNAFVSPGQIWEEDGGVFGISCPPGYPREATVSANVTDNVGVTTVSASWSDPLGSHSTGMGQSGSTFTTNFGGYPADTWDPDHLDPYTHAVTITIVARDAAGNESQTTVSVTVTEAGECIV